MKDSKKSSFTLAAIIAIVAAIAFAGMLYFSFYFANNGKQPMPLIIAIVFFVVTLLLSLLATKAKKVSVPFRFHKNAIIEMVSVSLFVLVGVVGLMLSNHFFTVSQRYGDIKKSVASVADDVNSLEKSYGENLLARSKTYSEWLHGVIINKNVDEDRYNSIFKNADSATLVRNFRNDISAKDSVAFDLVSELESTMSTYWGLFVILPKIQNVDTVVSDRVQELKKCSEAREEGLREHRWEFKLKANNDFEKLFTQKSPRLHLLTIGVVLVILLIILLPYWVAQRDGRSKGLWYELMNERGSQNDGGVFGY